jgi:lipopolysaccharide transport system permease protein/teichoic acid transport system permease protein
MPFLNQEGPMAFYNDVKFFINEIFQKRYVIYELSKRDFQQRYIGSYLGLSWVIIEPLAFMLILWFVFSFGLRTNPGGDIPFVAYLFTGFIAFNFFQDAVSANSGVIRSFAFLVQKGNFRLSILPIVKIISAFILHMVFLLIVMGILLAIGITPSLYWFQTLYYIAASLFLILGIGWLVSALGVFVKDITHIISILLRFAFWLTPIIWNINIVPEKFRFFLKLNPLFYVIQGYRDSFLYKTPLSAHLSFAFYFWGFSLIMFIAGVLVFRRLRPHFADVI